MSKSRHCFVDARASLSLFDNDELEQFTKDVINRARNYSDLRGSKAIRKAADEIGTERLNAMADGMQIKINDAEKLESGAEKIRNKKFSLMDMIARTRKSFSENIESAQKSSRKQLLNSFFGRLSAEEMSILQTGKSDLEIARAIDDEISKTQREGISPEARSIAKKFMEYIDYRNSKMVSSNAISIYNLNSDRYLKAIHDKQLIISGGKNLIEAARSVFRYDIEQNKIAWREFTKSKLNLLKTFENTEAMGIDGKLDMAKVDKIMNEIHSNITTDNPELFVTSTGGGQRMFFYWNDVESMLGYAQKYGKKSLFENIYTDAMASGNKIGMAEMFGSDAIKTFNKLAEVQNKVNPVSKMAAYHEKNAFKMVAGIDQTAVNPKIAAFFGSIRSLISMKSLGTVAFQSMGDISNGISFAKRWGFDYSTAYTDYMLGLFNALPSEERRDLAQMFKEHTDHHLGYVSRFLDVQNVPQIVNTASSYFFRGIGLHALDNGNKISGFLTLAKGLGRQSETKWADLAPETKKQFAKFDFTEREWDLLRGKNQKRGMFTLDNVEALTNDDIKKAYGDLPPAKIRDELYRKVYSMFDVWAENSVLSPGVYMRSIMYGSTRSGTIAGELMRTFLQFKSYTINALDKVFYQGFKDADSATAKLGFITYLMAATIPMAYLSYFMNNLARGRSMPSWDYMNNHQRFKASMDIMAPSLGMLVNFTDQRKLNDGLIESIIDTPSLKLIGNAMSAPIQLANGDVKAFKKSLKKVMVGVTPGLSLPFIAPYMEKALGQEAPLMPGQHKLWGN